MRRHLSAVGTSLAALMAATGLLAAAPPPATASSAQAVSGLTRVTNISATNSNTSRQVAAVCPAGRAVVGGGAEIVNGLGQVVLQRLQPQQTATDERFVAGAREVATGYTGAWALQAYAVCADPLPGQQILVSTSPATSESQRSVAAFCPDGQREVGIGGRINNGAGQVRLTDLYDFFGPPSSLLIVGAREDSDGYAGAWGLSSYIICADESATTGFVAAGNRSPTDSQNKSATARCPAGTQVLTAGASVAGNLGASATTASLVIDRIGIDSSLTSVTVRVVEDQNGTTGAWSVLAFALCAPPSPAGP